MCARSSERAARSEARAVLDLRRTQDFAHACRREHTQRHGIELGQCRRFEASDDSWRQGPKSLREQMLEHRARRREFSLDLTLDLDFLFACFEVRSESDYFGIKT